MSEYNSKYTRKEIEETLVEKVDKSYVDDKFIESADANGYEYVDMGEAGIWATCNVGAAKPEEVGLYFAWGETEGYESLSDKPGGFERNNYKFLDSNGNFNKYTDLDGLNTLELEDDAAHVNMGGDWRTPTDEEYEKLISNCNYEFTKNYKETGISGYIFRLKSNLTKELFFPMCDMQVNIAYYRYWCGGINTLNFLTRNLARVVVFSENTNLVDTTTDVKYYGHPIRAILISPEKYLTKKEASENYATKEKLDNEIQQLNLNVANNTQTMASVINILEDEYVKKTELNIVTTELKLFGITVEGTVSVKLVDDDSEILYNNTFTDCTVDIALSNKVTKFNQIIIEGTGTVTKCKCPLIVDDNPAWVANVKHWQDTVIDVKRAYPQGIPYETRFTQQGCKLINVGGAGESDSPRPCPYFEWDKTYPIKTPWCTIYYFEPETAFDWIKWIKEEYNAYVQATGYGPYIHGYVGTRIFFDDQEFTDDQIRALDCAVNLKGEPFLHLNCANYNMLQRLGWCDGTNATNIDLSIPSLQQVSIRNLNSNINLTSAHIDDDSINLLGRLAKTVTNKTITLSGYNYYRLTNTQRSQFTSKGFNVAVNWDNDETYKLLYEMKNSGQFNPASIEDDTIQVGKVRAISDNVEAMSSDELVEVTADNGYWLTEADDVEYRTFANSVITNTPNAWKQVDNDFKVEYDNRRKQWSRDRYNNGKNF